MTWTCKICTFSNHVLMSNCEMCLVKKNDINISLEMARTIRAVKRDITNIDNTNVTVTTNGKCLSLHVPNLIVSERCKWALAELGIGSNVGCIVSSYIDDDDDDPMWEFMFSTFGSDTMPNDVIYERFIKYIESGMTLYGEYMLTRWGYDLGIKLSFNSYLDTTYLDDEVAAFIREFDKFYSDQSYKSWELRRQLK